MLLTLIPRHAHSTRSTRLSKHSVELHHPSPSSLSLSLSHHRLEHTTFLQRSPIFLVEMVRISTRLCEGLSLLLTLATAVQAQQAQNPQFLPAATKSWSYNSQSCLAGLSAGAAGDANGTVVDSFGATYQVNCGQRASTPDSFASPGTNGRGLSACFRSCDKTPGCVGFAYYGTVTGRNPEEYRYNSSSN